MKKNNTAGIILIIIGIAFMIHNSNLIDNDILLSILGLGLLVGYYYKKNTGFLISGLVILGIGVNSIADRLIANINLSGFITLTGLGFIFLLLYFANNIKGFVYPGCILPAIGTFSLIDSLLNIDIGWLFFLLLSISFYLIYIFEHRKNNVKWPLIPASILLAFSALTFLTSINIFGIGLWEILIYIWPAILIIIGIRLIYNNKNNNKKEKF